MEISVVGALSNNLITISGRQVARDALPFLAGLFKLSSTDLSTLKGNVEISQPNNTCLSEIMRQAASMNQL